MGKSSAKRLTLLQTRRHSRVLLVRTAAGPRMGFGHLRRTLTLAGLLRNDARPIFLLDREDHWSQAHATCQGFEYLHFDPRRPLRKIASVSSLLIDTRRRAGLARLVAEARSRGIPVVSIHDLGLLPLASDIAIDGSILARSARFPHARASHCGTPFFILDNEYARMRAQKTSVRPNIRRVVINLGGGDSRRFYRTVLRGLKDTGIPLEVIGLRGFCDWNQEAFAAGPWDPIRFRWFPKRGNVACLVAGADMVISAGGRSAYEALCLGLPLCALSWDRHQAKTISALARAGVCVNLGLGSALRSEDVRRTVCELQADVALRRSLSARGRKLIDGSGARRVARILHRLMQRRCFPSLNSRSPGIPSAATGRHRPIPERLEVA